MKLKIGIEIEIEIKWIKRRETKKAEKNGETAVKARAASHAFPPSPSSGSAV